MDSSSIVPILIVLIVIGLLIWWFYSQSNKNNCKGCKGNRSPLSYLENMGSNVDWKSEKKKVEKVWSDNKPNQIPSLDNYISNYDGEYNQGRASYLNEIEQKYDRYHMANNRGILETEPDDDRFKREYAGSYVAPLDTTDYNDERPMKKPNKMGFGLSHDKEQNPISWMKTGRVVKEDADVDQFKDVITDEKRNIDMIDTAFSPEYLTTTKGQSYDLRPAFAPTLNEKFMRTKDENDYDCMYGAKLHSRGPLVLHRPIRTYAY